MLEKNLLNETKIIIIMNIIDKIYNKYNILIISLIIILIALTYLILQIFYTKVINYEPYVIYSSLIATTITSIAIILNIKYQEKLMKQNETKEFIQLRFKESKKAILELKLYIEKTLAVYNGINSSNHTEIHNHSRSFLIMQFVKHLF